jgi:hypothetical protein
MSIDSALKSDGSDYASATTSIPATTASSKKPATRSAKKNRRTNAFVTSSARTAPSQGVTTRSSIKRLSKKDRDGIAEDAKPWNPLYNKTGIFDPRVSTVREEGSGSEFEKQTVSSRSRSSRSGNGSSRRATT